MYRADYIRGRISVAVRNRFDIFIMRRGHRILLSTYDGIGPQEDIYWHQTLYRVSGKIRMRKRATRAITIKRNPRVPGGGGKPNLNLFSIRFSSERP